jgi:hypothetical protein
MVTTAKRLIVGIAPDASLHFVDWQGYIMAEYLSLKLNTLNLKLGAPVFENTYIEIDQ